MKQATVDYVAGNARSGGALLATIIKQFDVAFDPRRLETRDPDVFLLQMRGIEATSHLTHAGYNYPLLLYVRKKLAKIFGPYPPVTFEGEDRFDHWVAEGACPIRFNASYRTVTDLMAPGQNWQWHLPGERIPELNQQ
jgi:hypothetical protein